MPSAQQKRGEHKVHWVEDGNVNCNQPSTQEHMPRQSMMKIVDYMFLAKKQEDRQLVWTTIFMFVKEIWNMLLFVCCGGIEKDKSYEIESSHPSIVMVESSPYGQMKPPLYQGPLNPRQKDNKQ